MGLEEGGLVTRHETTEVTGGSLGVWTEAMGVWVKERKEQPPSAWGVGSTGPSLKDEGGGASTGRVSGVAR